MKHAIGDKANLSFSETVNNLGVNLNSVFVVCPDCGDKRCSKAQSHVNTCKEVSDV